MKQRTLPNDVRRDMAFGQPFMLTTIPDDDMEANTDIYLVNDLRIAYRTRRFKSTKYGEISIRANRTSGAETEMSKMINGKAKAQIYIFEFIDCWIICSFKGILKCLLIPEQHYIQPNHDGKTSACYIKISDVPHFKIDKVVA